MLHQSQVLHSFALFSQIFIHSCAKIFNFGLVPFPCKAALKHPRTPPTNPSADYPTGDSDHVSKRARPMGMSDEVICYTWFQNTSYGIVLL